MLATDVPLRVAVDVINKLGVFVKRPGPVEGLVTFACVRMRGVETEAGVAVLKMGGLSVSSSVGGAIADSSVRGVVIAGSVPR
jgi:hypothetical protein